MSQWRSSISLPLFWRILLLVLLAGFMPMLILSFIVQQGIAAANQDTTRSATGALNDRSQDAANVVAKQVADTISGTLNDIVQDTLIAASLPRTAESYTAFTQAYTGRISYPAGTPGNVAAQTDTVPLFPEIAYVDATGHEKLRVVNGKPVPDTTLRDVSVPANTTYKTETYFADTRALTKGQVYVSHVFAWATFLPNQPSGPDPALVGSNFGKYSAIMRFASSLYTSDGGFDGMVVLTYDMRNLTQQVIHVPATVEPTPVIWPTSTISNYTWLWDNDGYLISYPQLNRLRAVDANGNTLPTWANTGISDQQKNAGLFRMQIGNATQQQMYNDTLQGKADAIKSTVGDMTVVNTYAPIPFAYGVYSKTGMFGGVALSADINAYHTDVATVQSSLAQQSANLQNQQYIVLLAALFVLVILVVVITRSVTRPVSRLTHATQQVQTGSADLAVLDPLIKGRVRDEISQFAANFQQMAQTVRLRESQLAEYNANLEGLVRQRTQQLEQANGQITELNKQLTTENRRLSAELEVTRRLQQMILPKDHELNSVPGLDVAGFMEPADEVGGDYYDVLTMDGRTKIGIGDVTGHGLASGVLMLMVQTAVRTLQNTKESDPATFLNVINRTIYDNVNRMRSDKNLSLALIDYSDGSISLSGQHEEMIIVRANGAVEVVDTVDLGFPIGLEEDIAAFVSHTNIRLDAGDVVVMYTDGVTEADNGRHELYGMERLIAVIKANHIRSAAAIKSAVIADVKAFIGNSKVYDDITLVVMKQKEVATPVG